MAAVPASSFPILEDTTALYIVRFPSGDEQEFARDELQDPQARPVGCCWDQLRTLRRLWTAFSSEWVIYRCVTGSHAYGLDEEESDTDVRGVFVAPPDVLWSLQGAPEYLERVRWRRPIGSCASSASWRSRPTPTSWSASSPRSSWPPRQPATSCLTLRDAFLSRFVHQTFNGYVLSQFKKLERDLRVAGEPKWKHVMHLIRLLLSGITLLSTGTMEVRVLEHRARLLDIRRGQVPWEEVEAWRLELHRSIRCRTDKQSASGNARLPKGQSIPAGCQNELDRGSVSMKIDPRLEQIAIDQPYPLIFASVSGAHLYGFESRDSDWDLRGVHVLPVNE